MDKITCIYNRGSLGATAAALMIQADNTYQDIRFPSGFLRRNEKLFLYVIGMELDRFNHWFHRFRPGLFKRVDYFHHAKLDEKQLPLSSNVVFHVQEKPVYGNYRSSLISMVFRDLRPLTGLEEMDPYMAMLATYETRDMQRDLATADALVLGLRGRMNTYLTFGNLQQFLKSHRGRDSSSSLNSILQTGRYYRDEYGRRIKTILDTTTENMVCQNMFSTFPLTGREKVPFLKMQQQMIHLVPRCFIEKFPFVAFYNDVSGYRRVEFRSVTGSDVALSYALSQGGTGHRHACSYKLMRHKT